MNLCEPIPGAESFKWIEALTLREWGWCAYPSDEQQKNIKVVAEKMQVIRNIFNRPVYIRSWLRPHEYNSEIGGAVLSAHREGRAVDFVVDGYHDIGGSDHVRSVLQNRLFELQIRMERKPGAGWVHIDTREPGQTGYYFTP